jgi:excisionase family DNA binding protein
MKSQFELEDYKAISSTVVETLKPLLCACSGKKSDDGIMGVKDLAIYLGVNQSWVQKKVALKEIPYFKCGKYNRFRKSAVDKWIETETVRPMPPLKIANK